MGHRTIATLALALVLAGTAHAQVPAAGSQGGLITRFFKKPANTTRVEKEDVASPSVAVPSLSPATRLALAQADLVRRQEVCQKLREIALETGDDDLARKADQLDQRAWDAFVQRTGDETTLRQHLSSTETPSRLLRSMSRGSKDEGQAALGEEHR